VQREQQPFDLVGDLHHPGDADVQQVRHAQLGHAVLGTEHDVVGADRHG